MRDKRRKNDERIARLIREELERETPDNFASIRNRLEEPACISRPRRYRRALTAVAACFTLCAVLAGGPLLWRGMRLGLFAAASDAARLGTGRYLFTVYSRDQNSGSAGDVAAQPNESLPVLSSAGYNQLGTIGPPWKTEAGNEYRLDMELNFSFLGKGIRCIAYTVSGPEGAALIERNETEEKAVFLYEDADGSYALDEREPAGTAGCVLTAEEQADPSFSLWLRLRLDAAPYQDMDSLQALSGLYDAFRAEIRQTRLTAVLHYKNGDTETVSLQLRIAEDNDHAITVTLLDQPAGSA